MTTAKSTSIPERSRSYAYPAARFNEKGYLQVWGWRCSKDTTRIYNVLKLPKNFGIFTVVQV
jgi:hypothetical protein